MSYQIGQQVFAKVYDADTYEFVSVRGVVDSVEGDRYGVLMPDRRTGTLASFLVDGADLSPRSEEHREVWTCTVGGKDIRVWL